METHRGNTSLKPRFFDDQTSCALRKCLLPGRPFDRSQEAVVVATCEKVRRRLSQKTLDKFAAQWTPQGRNVFHAECWQRLLTADKPSSRSEQRLLDTAEESLERYEGIGSLSVKAKAVAELLRNSTVTVAFTGAGLSVTSGIPDYRGTAGVDTKEFLGVAAHADEDDSADVNYKLLRPTSAHLALAELYRRRLLQYVITQNCDNLHMRSGVLREALSELHGNVFVEYCAHCGTEFVRDECVDLDSTDRLNADYAEVCPRCQWNHFTGRVCEQPECASKGHKLRDTIVNFGDPLPAMVCGGWDRAEEFARKADLMLVLGSSLTVTPANSLCEYAKNLVVCNLQATEFDRLARVRVYSDCDSFMNLVMAELSDEA